jgi:transcriptional regulator with XRE-family HTH domain
MDDSEASAARTIGEVIRRRRVAIGMSQTALADALGTRQSTVSSWERDENGVGLDVLYKIAKPLQWEQADIDAAIDMMKAAARAAAGVATPDGSDDEPAQAAV